MDMIGHQHIGMQVHTGFLQTFSEPMEVGLIVLFGKKASRMIMTMLAMKCGEVARCIRRRLGMPYV